MSKRWFVCKSEAVSGPFSNEEIISLSNREDLTHSLVWWPGLTEWVRAGLHLSKFSEFVNSQVDVVERPVWFFRYNNIDSEALSIRELALQLKGIPNAPKTVLVKSPESFSFQPIFKHLELMDLLGINQRKNKRVPVRGSVNIFVENELFQGQASTISVGGIGFKALNGTFFEGQKIRVELKSPDLVQSFHTQAKIVHCTTTGDYGVAFDRLNPEHQILIGDYIRKVSHSGNLKKTT